MLKSGDTVTLTTTQAIVRYLAEQYIEIDGRRMRICGGGFGIFGHGNVTCLGEALADVRDGRIVPVPVHLRDGHYQGAQRLGHGEGYQYAHDAEDGIAAQDYLGVEREYYRPVDRGFEKELAARLEKIRAKLRAGQ